MNEDQELHREHLAQRKKAFESALAAHGLSTEDLTSLFEQRAVIETLEHQMERDIWQARFEELLEELKNEWNDDRLGMLRAVIEQVMNAVRELGPEALSLTNTQIIEHLVISWKPE